MDQRLLRTIYLYEHKLGSSSRETAKKINAAFGPDTTTDRTVRNWFQRFDDGDTSLKDIPHTGCPVTFDEEALRHELELHPDSSTRDLEKVLGHHYSTIDRHLQSMGYRKVLSRWTPHALTDHDCAVRVSICESLLLRPHRKDFLESIITGDESWVFYENDTRHAFWVPPGEQPPAQPKPGFHGNKLLLSVFWDSQGMLFWELLDNNQTVNANIYTEQLRKLADAVREKRPKRLKVSLLHDNARPHTAKLTREFLEKLGWTTVPHPPYSPDLAPSDYHLFRALKQHLREKKFENYDHLKNDLADFFDCQPLSFWRKGIETLPSKWLSVLDNDGDYIVN